MKFRHHRGGFKESMETVIEVNSLEELKTAISKEHPTNRPVAKIEFDRYGYDARNGWDSYIVNIAWFEASSYYEVAGYSDGVLS